MSGRKQAQRRDSRRLGFESLAPRMVLSVNPLGLAAGPGSYEAAAFARMQGHEQRAWETVETSVASPLDRSAMHQDFGRVSPGGFGRGTESFQYNVGQPLIGQTLIVAGPQIAPGTRWVLSIEFAGGALQIPLVSYESASYESASYESAMSSGQGMPYQSAAPHVDVHSSLPPGIAPLAAIATLGAPGSPQSTAAAGNGSPSGTAGSLTAPAWLASVAQTLQNGADRLAVSPGATWSPTGRTDRTQQNDLSQTPGNLLVPDDSRTSEGGLIELETGRATRPTPVWDDEPLGELRKKRLLGEEELAAFEWVWAELGQALKSANEALANANSAERRVADDPQVVAAQGHKILAGEGGMIELAVDSAVVDVIQRAPVAPPSVPAGALEMPLEAGVALFQAFELGTVPGESDTSLEAGAPVFDEAPQDSAASDDAGETHEQRAAMVAGAALVPLAMRARATDKVKTTQRRRRTLALLELARLR